MRRTIFALLAATLLAPLAGAEEPGEGPALLIELEAGPALGMDRLLRGGRLALALGLEAGGIEAALRGALAYDASLAGLSVEAGILLGLGGGLRLAAGREAALIQPGIASAGVTARLEPAGWPSVLAVGVEWLELGQGDGKRPRIEASAELAYSAYRVLGPAPPATGVAAFSAGFRAWLGLRLSWLARPRRRA